VREQAEKVENRLQAAWVTCPSTEEFLVAAAGILDAKLRFSGETRSASGGEPRLASAVQLTESITWGRGLGSTLEVEVPESKAFIVRRIMPRLGELIGVLADREAAEIESDLRLRGELLLELLVEHGAPTGSVLRAAERYGIDLGTDHLVVLLDLDDFTQLVRQGLLPEVRILRLKRDLTATLEREGRALFGKVWVLPHSDEFVLVVAARSADWPPARVVQAVRTLQQETVAVLRPYRVKGITAGLGFSYSGVQGLRKSFAEAHEALLVGRAQFGGHSVTHFKDLGLHRFLFGWFDSPRSQSLAYEFIRPMLEEDPSQRAQLLPTLRAYLDARGRMTQAAKVLGIHRNSLRYRLDRIAQLLGLDLDDADVQLVLQLVVRTLPEDLGGVPKKSP
jgi:sugar diacid utilization regulator